MHQLEKDLNLEPKNICLYQLTKNIATDMGPYTYSTLRELSVITEIYILSCSPKLADEDPAGNLD